MLDFFRAIFGTDFMPHLYCLRSDPGVLWLQVISDLLIAVAYYAIPLILFSVVLRRKETLFRQVAVLFVLFIAACGTTHLLEIWTIWNPMYRLEGVVKAITALLSVTTAIVLVWLLPQIRRLPSVGELEKEIEERRRTEDATREQDQKFRNFIEGVQDYAIYMLDRDGYVRSWNSGAERIKGYTAEEIMGKHFSTFYPPVGLALSTPEEALRIAAETGKFESEGWRQRKDGTGFWANVIIRPLLDSAGEITGFSKITRDMSESRKMEARFQVLLEAAPDAILIVSRQGEIGYINAQGEQLFGYKRAEVLGKSVDMLNPEPVRKEQARFREEIFSALQRIEVNAEAGVLGLRKDGSEFPVEFTLSPLETKDGWVFLISIRDITGRLKDESRFRGLLESAPDAMVISGSDGRIELTNLQAERLFGYSREEMAGQPVEILIPRDLHSDYQMDSDTFLRGDFHREMGAGLDLRARRKDGTEFPVEITFGHLEGPNGTSMTAAIRDVTERKKAEANFRSLLEATPDAIIMYSFPDRITYVNRRMEALFGYDRTELVGQSVEMLIPEQTREERRRHHKQLLQALSADTVAINEVTTCIRKDGIEFDAEASVVSVETADGRMILASVRDITERKKAENRFRGLLESAPDAMVIVNSAGRIELANSQTERLFGYSSAELLGQLVDMLLPQDLQGGHEEHRRRFFEAPKTREMGAGLNLHARRKDGTQFPVEISLSPLDGPGGVSVTAAIRDVTERKKAEARFRGLLESAPDAMVIVNSDGVVELANRQTEKLFGYARLELVGQSVDILVPENVRATHGNHLKGYFRAPRPREMGAGIDLMALRKDGTQFPVEISLSPLEGPGGVSVTAAIRDVTERKKSETRFRGLLESAPDAMVIVNPHGVIELANMQTEKLFGYSRMELVGQSVDVLVPESVRASHGDHLQGYFHAPRPREMGAGLDLMAVRKDGTWFPVEISLSPMQGPDGISVTAAIRDITERKRAAQLLAQKVVELRHSNEELEQFAYIASHDLQEPLRMVASYTQLLARRYQGRLDADADEFIHYAVDGTQRMKRLIEDLLTYSRAGKSAPPTREFSSEAALCVALNNLCTAIQESRAVVTHDPLPTIWGVEGQVVQILQNLIGNGIKYRGERTPRIHISASASDTEWIFSVIDNGIGIDPQFFDRIFVIFKRLHGREEYEGTGIGLAICKRILQQQGGRIWVESQPGQGSTFRFSLPKEGNHHASDTR